jgi:WD40 repeat protein
MKIWQEQVTPSPLGVFDRTFNLCANTTCPPTAGASPVASDASIKSGINVLSFDNSGTLLATRSESMPTTIWIWDIASKVLKAIMVLHAPLARVTWHPVINELLMIRCEGEESKGLVHLWEPSWVSPKIVDFGTQLPEGKIIGKSVIRWLNVDSNTPCLFFSDTQDCILVSLAESDDEDLPWQDTVARGVDIYGQREESPLDLVGADESKFYGKIAIDAMMNGDPTMTGMTGGSDEVDDTFRFKKFVE